MFRYNRAVDFTRIGNHNTAVDQLREHQLMDAGRGRMNPFELARLQKLLRLDGPANQNIGVRNFLGNAIVIGKMHPLDLRKSALQASEQPRRGLPKFKGMVVDDQDFHDWVNY